MPHETTPLTPRQKLANKNAKARKLLSGRRDDSDNEDLPWEWIYETVKGDDEDEEDEKGEEEDGIKTQKKRRRRNASKSEERKIIGAKMGKTLKVKIGDAVLLRAEGGNAPWVGIIWQFCEEEDGEKAANFLCESFSKSFPQLYT